MSDTVAMETVRKLAPDPELELIQHALALQGIRDGLRETDDGKAVEDALCPILPEMITSIADVALGLSRKTLSSRSGSRAASVGPLEIP